MSLKARTLAIIIRYVETDMKVRDAVTLARMLWNMDLDQVKRGMVQGHGVIIDGIYYYEVDWEATTKVLVDLGMKLFPGEEVDG